MPAPPCMAIEILLICFMLSQRFSIISIKWSVTRVF
ncbi:MAG: hypothetical protein ACI9M3_001523 [Bacteroidia bacterium]